MWHNKTRVITAIRVSTDDHPDGEWLKLGHRVKAGGAITGFISSRASWWRHDPLGFSTVGIEVDGEMYSVGCHRVSGIEWEDRKRRNDD